MKRMLINATQPDEVRVAITDGPQLIDLDIEVPGQEQKKANIYKGVISSIEPSLGAVFVNYGAERHGFLPLKEISREYYLTQDADQLEHPDIRKVLKEGQPLVIQIEKEERGNKGAALTTFISLAGSFLVLMPNNPEAGGISRRIEGEERDQMRAAIGQLTVPEGMGVILRTAGVGRSKEELDWDLSVLLRYWEAIKQAATLKSGAYLIHQEGDVIIRGIRDNLRQDIEEIVIDNEAAYQCAYNYLNHIRPDLINRVKLYKDVLPLFSRFQIERQIETAYQREVQLPSGGSIVIDHSEALVAIDINSSRATKGSNIEETALNTNLEAAQEIARQLRLRDIGGLVVIDFIDMTPTRNQREVENCLRNALHADRARIQLGRISRFGLMEMSRQRLRSSLSKSNHMTCPLCEGQGTVRSIESQAISIIHLLQEQAVKSRHVHFQLQLPLELSTYFSNEKKDAISQIEEHCQVKITLIPNQFLEFPHYHIRSNKCPPEHLGHTKGVASYKLLKSFKSEQTNANKKGSAKAVQEPAINQFLTTATPVPSTPGPIMMPTSPGKPAANSSLIKRLWSKMFGAENQVMSGRAPQAKAPSSPAAPHGQQRRPQQNRRHRPRPPQQQNPDEQSAENPNQQRNKKPSSRHRTRRGSRGGSQQRGRTDNRRPQDPNKPAGNRPEGASSRTQQPFPDDMDNALPKADHPASTMPMTNVESKKDK